MRARTIVLVAFVAALLVLATVSHGYAAQRTPNEQRTDKQEQLGNNPNLNNEKSMTNEAGSQGETPRTGGPKQPIIIKPIGWSWLLISGLIGFLLGRITSLRRRPYGRDEDIRRNRTA